MAGRDSAAAQLPQWVIRFDEDSRKAEPYQPHNVIGGSRSKKSIHKVSANFRQADDDPEHLYRPYRVSFGPYYHGDESCQPTEQDKEVALRHLLRRSGKPLELYYKAVARVAVALKENYEELDPKWQDNDTFLKLMVLDGCFLSEILSGVGDPQSSYAPDIPLLQVHEDPKEMELYRHDMLLLANQLPLLLLGVLNRVALDGTEISEILEDNIARMFSLRPGSVTYIILRKHVLEAARAGLVLPIPRPLRLSGFFRMAIIIFSKRIRNSSIGRYFGIPTDTDKETGLRFSIPSATELHEVGIGLTAVATCLNYISLRRNTLKLPQVVVDGATKSMFLNIIAFEQDHDLTSAKVATSSYIYFMRHLIQSASDVKLLQSRGIIDSALPSDEVVQLFQSLSEYILLDSDMSLASQHREVGKKLRKRYNEMSNEWRKDLFQNYLRSPWAIISVIAAILLFTLTIIQTVYTVLGYYNQK